MEVILQRFVLKVRVAQFTRLGVCEPDQELGTTLSRKRPFRVIVGKS
jgi:hypothetical protein